MGVFNEISDKTYGLAGELIRSVEGKGDRPEVEIFPGFEAMIAGTAVAMEKHAPHALYSSHESTADRWVKQGTNEWRHMHTAVARVMDMHANAQFDMRPKPEDVMSFMAADLIHQTSFARVDTAIRLKDPAFREDLTSEQNEMAERGLHDKAYASDISRKRIGLYHNLPTYEQREIGETLLKGDNLPEGMSGTLKEMSKRIQAEIWDVGHRARDIDARIADFHEFAKPLFRPVTDEHIDRADRLARGVDLPVGPVEIGIVAHARTIGHLENAVARNARGQALADYQVKDPGGPEIHLAAYSDHVATRIEAHRLAVEDAREYALDHVADEATPPDHVVQIAWERDLSRIGETAIGLYQAVESGDRVPGLVAAQMGEMGDMIERSPYGDIEKGRSISYEGIDRSDQDAEFKADYYLPGDKVRLNENVQVSGVDREDLKERLGLSSEPDASTADPLLISKTVVRGVERENILGNMEQRSFVEYEFEGQSGRFPAHSFQNERGDEHVYGVVAVEQDKMWLIPFDPNLDPMAEAPRMLGEPREIVKSLISADPVVNADNLAIMKHDVGQDAVSGEFVFRPQSFGDKSGPIDLVSAPWMSSAYANEREMATKAISEHIAKDTGAARNAMLAQQASHQIG